MDQIQTLFIDDALKTLSFGHFENEKGKKVKEVLPGSNEQFKFSFGDISGVINTRERTIYNISYQGEILAFERLVETPELLQGFPECIYNHWYDVFGEVTGSAQVGHPGDPPFSIEGANKMLSDVLDQWEIIKSDPMVSDLVSAIQDKNYQVAIRFLGSDNPDQVMSPASGHELHNLFANEDISIFYSDSEIALLKPEYNHERREQMRNRLRQQWLRFQGEELEEAFIVGKDDTPVGLFAHSVDGTRLNSDQKVTREMIHEVMGFDKSYAGESKLNPNLGERIRLQGDLAVEYVESTTVSESGRCYLPIDNHYIAVNDGFIPTGESKTEEPIQVHIPEDTVLNISHDEHENVIVTLEEGVYRFYLLPRGIRPQRERPNWDPIETADAIPQ
jgi:hypothetical protein